MRSFTIVQKLFLWKMDSQNGYALLNVYLASVPKSNFTVWDLHPPPYAGFTGAFPPHLNYLALPNTTGYIYIMLGNEGNFNKHLCYPTYYSIFISCWVIREVHHEYHFPHNERRVSAAYRGRARLPQEYRANAERFTEDKAYSKRRLLIPCP